MRPYVASIFFAILFAAFTSVSLLAIENAPAPAPNSYPTYQNLRNIGLSGEAVQVNNFKLVRDAATFLLKSGTVCFVSAVEGKVTGAVFVGQGEFTLIPPTPTEAKSLSLLTRQAQFQEVFERAVLGFTDDSYNEIKKGGTTTPSTRDAGQLREIQHHLRTELHYNLTARILQDVLGSETGGLFLAFIHGKNYNKKMVYSIDPRGASPLLIELAPEEVQLATYDESKIGVWAAFHLSGEYNQRTANSAENHAVITIEHQTLDTTLQKSGNLTGRAATSFVCRASGLRVIPLNLHGSLRVQSVTTESGEQLEFVQEDKREDPDFYVILPKPLALNARLTIITTYGGKDAVSSEGGSNYYPIARLDWFPNHPNEGLGEFASYDMTFRIPKGMKMVATGQLVKESEQGDQNVSVWKSEAPITAAGFIFGKFKREQGKIEKPSYQVEAYANAEVPDKIRSLLTAAQGNPFTSPTTALGAPLQPELALGTMSTTGMAKVALAEAQVALQVFSNYFGPTPLPVWRSHNRRP